MFVVLIVCEFICVIKSLSSRLSMIWVMAQSLAALTPPSDQANRGDGLWKRSDSFKTHSLIAVDSDEWTKGMSSNEARESIHSMIIAAKRGREVDWFAGRLHVRIDEAEHCLRWSVPSPLIKRPSDNEVSFAVNAMMKLWWYLYCGQVLVQRRFVNIQPLSHNVGGTYEDLSFHSSV